MKQNDFYEVDGCIDFIPVKLIKEHKYLNLLEVASTESGYRAVVPSIYSFPEPHEPQKPVVPKFVAENGEKLLAKTGKNKGNLKADFVIGDKMIESLKNDNGFANLYHGFPDDDVQKEMIVFGEIEGVPVKGKLDSVNLSRGYFVDLKTMKSIYAEEWNAELRKRVPAAVNNILGFGYHGQLGLYRELLQNMTGQEFRPYIVAVSKEEA